VLRSLRLVFVRRDKKVVGVFYCRVFVRHFGRAFSFAVRQTRTSAALRRKWRIVRSRRQVRAVISAFNVLVHAANRHDACCIAFGTQLLRAIR
jgi:uncharacterized protein (DUF1697 family)